MRQTADGRPEASAPVRVENMDTRGANVKRGAAAKEWEAVLGLTAMMGLVIILRPVSGMVRSGPAGRLNPASAEPQSHKEGRTP